MITYRTATTRLPAPAQIETDPVRRMADAMLVIQGGGRTVDREALSLMGFSNAEIDRYGVEARDLANAQSQRRTA